MFFDRSKTVRSGREPKRLPGLAVLAASAALAACGLLRAADPAPVLATTRNLRCAVNQEMAPAATPLKDGDEVAFFPPVTGG